MAIRKKAVKFKMPAGTSNAEGVEIQSVNVQFNLIKQPQDECFAGRFVSTDNTHVVFAGPFSNEDYGPAQGSRWLNFNALDPAKSYTGVLITSDEEIDMDTVFDS